MSSAYLKGKLKSLKESLAAKDWNGVEKNANDVLTSDSSNYNARVFLSLALFNLSRFDEAEESYKKSIELAPTQTLARQGLASFYEKRSKWNDCSVCLLELMEIFLTSGDPTKYAESLQKLIEVRRNHGTRLEIIESLSHLLPSSPSYPLLQTLPPASPTSPLASTVHSIQLALISSLPTLETVLALSETEEIHNIDTEIKKRRQRLNGPGLTTIEIRKQVESEWMRESRIPNLLKAILNDPEAGNQEELRRETERKLLNHRRTYLKSLPSRWDPTDLNLKKVEKRSEVKEDDEERKGKVRKEVEELAGGMVLIGVVEESAWQVVLEWSDDYADWDKMSWRELDRYCVLFPETGLSQIIKASQSLLPQTETREEEEEVANVPLASDEMAEIIEKGLASSSDSLIAHLLSLHFFSEESEWESVVQVAEAGIQLLERIQTEIGRGLLESRRTLESQLAIALVYLNPPANHLRAFRYLTSLLSTSDVDTASTIKNIPLLSAKAYVLQASEKFADAVEVWNLILSCFSSDTIPISEELEIEVQSERSWSLYHLKELDDAEVGLLKVVTMCEERKARREEERIEKEKIRSKGGIEKPKGDEGETEKERDERAKNWWRFGQCLWDLGEKDLDTTLLAHEAFTASIKASPTFSPPFTSLGIYYRALAEPDLPKASQCFQKAFELNAKEELAARYLAEEYAAISEWTLVEVVARRVVDGNKGKLAMGTKAAIRFSWAWKAIGGADLVSKKYSTAIIAFQQALRGSPTDIHTWIKLGVAYRLSGMHIAALKVFAKALALDPNSWYTQYSIGDVQREIGLLEPAIKTFRSILVERPDELGVRVVLAETALSSGLQQFSAGFIARAEESLVEALGEATKIIVAGSATRIAWKVVADTLVGLGKIPEPALLETSRPLLLLLLQYIEQESVDSKIQASNTVTAITLRNSIELIDSPQYFTALAVLAYKMRVLLETQNETSIGSAWLDLGVGIAALRPHLLDLGLTTDKDEALRQSIRCLKFALHKEPVNAIFWNALGVLSFDLSPRLSQHSFIKSIEYNSRSAIPWTNLGLFYLVQGDDELANQSFLKAQVLDPDWAPAWMGQATLADIRGDLIDSSVLLEHAFTLGGTTLEADIGFATRSYSNFRSSNDSTSATSALAAPLFALSRYLSHKPEDVNALHLNALILEQVGDLTTACEALQRAANTLEQLYEVDESPEVEGRFVVAQTNLGRMRLASLDYEGALSAFEAALSLLDPQAEDIPGGLSRSDSVILWTECKIGSGLAYFWSEDSEKAIEILEAASEDIESIEGGQSSFIAVTLGRIYWSQGDEDRALGAFGDLSHDSAPLFVKQTIQAFSIVTADQALLQNVARANKDPGAVFQADITRLNVLQKLIKGDQKGAVSAISKTLHSVPWATHPRRSLAALLLQIDPLDNDPESLVNLEICARLMRTNRVDGENAEARSMRHRSGALIELAKEGKEEEGLAIMERAVYLSPWSLDFRSDLDLVRKALK